MQSPLDTHRAAYLRLKEQLKAEHGLQDDDDTLLDTLEGEVGLHDLLAAMAREARFNESYSEGVSIIIAEAKERQARFDRKVERLRSLIADTMQECGIPKITAPDLTLSIGSRKPSPKVIDEDSLPIFYTVLVQTRKPDRDAIKNEYARCLSEGELFDIPGVTISNGGAVLTIRGK